MNSQLAIAWNDVAANLRGYIRARIRDHAAAEDILQDVFLKAHKSQAQLRSVENLQGWLFFIARNAIIDHYRKSKPAAELPEDLAVEAEDPVLENAEELREAFRKMVYSLPDPYREALVLTEYEGLTQKQLSERLGISLSGAKSRVQRGREKLKQDLLECCRLEFDRRGQLIECEPRQSDCCSPR